MQVQNQEKQEGRVCEVDELDSKIEVDSNDRVDRVVEIVGSALSLGSLSAKPASLRASGQSRGKEETRAAAEIQAWWRSTQMYCSDITSKLSEGASTATCHIVPLAVEQGHVSVLHYLFCHACIDIQMCVTTSGCSLLHIAAKHNHLTVVQYLCSRRANCNARDNEHATPLHYAAHLDFDVIRHLYNAP